MYIRKTTGPRIDTHDVPTLADNYSEVLPFSKTLQLFHEGGPNHIETSRLICTAN